MRKEAAEGDIGAKSDSRGIGKTSADNQIPVEAQLNRWKLQELAASLQKKRMKDHG